MKLVILKNKIIEALNFIERATGINSNLPILKNILIRANENKIYFNATNLEFAVTHSFSGKIIENGETTVPCSLFSNLARGLTSERVTLECRGKNLFILTDNYEASIQTQDAKEFPIIPKISNEKHKIQTTTKAFSENLSSVIAAAQYSEIRPEISGIYIHQNPTITLTATDSFRLAEKKTNITCDTKTENIKAIIPIKAAEETLRILSNHQEEPLSISFDETQSLFKTKETEIITRLIDGVFPDYAQIIPKEVKTKTTISRQELIQAIKLVSSFSTKINDVKISIDEGGKHMELSASSAGVGDNTYKIPAKIEGDPFSIAFNWHFLLDGLKSFKDEEITLGVNSNEKPATLSGSSDKNLLYVVMPLKV